MPEQRGLYPRMRVLEQVSYFAQQHGLSPRDADAAGRRWLDRMGLADRAKSKLEELSHGNQQRVQLTVALAHEPELLVLDEPFSGLDPIGTATMTEVLQDRARSGVGVVFSSHQLDLVEDVCEDVVIIARGRVVAAGAIEELKSRSGRRHLEVEVVGSDGSWLDGDGSLTVLERDGDRVKLLVSDRVDLDTLLSRARAAGEVRTFAYQPPKLSELFMEAVTPVPPGDGSTPVAEVTS
jgi:ABC-2 type transport system ATP-binding protein